MQLRDHPLMKYHGIANWPPVWTWRGGDRNQNIRGEVGVVRDVFLSHIEPLNRLFIIMEHQGNEYIGCVLFDAGGFCGQIHKVLYACRGQTVAELGSLDIDCLL